MRNWIIQADQEIQLMHHDWQFLRTGVSFNTTAGANNYTPAAAGVTDLSAWKPDSFRIYHTATGVGSETFLGDAVSYDEFRNYWLFNMRRTTQSRPITISIGPDFSLWLGPVPNDIYTVVGEYFHTPAVLSNDADVSEIPARFQMIIVYKAMMSYGTFEAAPEVLAAGANKYRELLSALTANQGPTPSLGGALV